MQSRRTERRRSNEERFWEKVRKGAPEDCWEWQAYLNHDGYGAFSWRSGPKKQIVNAHRASWLIHHGEIAAGLFVLHSCDNPACVNPAHLSVGTHDENMRQRMERGRYVTAFRAGETIRQIRRSPKRLGLSIEERIRASVKIDANGCWVWQKVRLLGYGYITVERTSRRAHRVAYEAFVGPIPAGKHILHGCDNRACCNPEHLRVGDHKENMREMADRGRAAKGQRNHFGRVRYPGEKHGNAKLTEAAVREILTSSDTHAALARKFSVTKGTIWKVRAGYSWNHPEVQAQQSTAATAAL